MLHINLINQAAFERLCDILCGFLKISCVFS